MNSEYFSVIPGAGIFRFCQFILLVAVFAFSNFSYSQNALPSVDISQKNDSITKKKRKGQLEAKVEYFAKDSMEFNVEEQKMFLFGNAEVKYEGTALKANYIELGLKENILYSHGTDSAGKIVGKPVFDDNGQNFTAEELRYNFKSKKGKIHKAITQEGDGYIHGDKIKKSEEDILYIEDGKYTTCSKPDPHFHIEATKLKVIKDDKIVTGPAYLVVENAPTPLAVPFGLFPNKKERSSGIVIPGYGQSPTLGFFLNEGGYYFGMNEYFDAKLLFDGYTHGSWAAQVASNYKKRYKFSGSLNTKYSVFLVGDEDLPSFQADTNFFIKWSHRQDPKANPTSNFSADVNAGTSNSYRKDISTQAVDFLTNTFASSITYQKNFSIFNKPANINFSGRHDQNTNDSIINVSFPQIAFNVSSFSIKPRTRAGKPKFYENIRVSLQSQLNNSVTFKEGIFKDHEDRYKGTDSSTRDTFLLAAPPDTLFEMMRNGMSHSIPVSANWKILKFMTLNPQVSYSEKWYFQTNRLIWNEDSLNNGIKNKYVIDTLKVYRFDRFSDYRAGATFSTTVYGMYNLRAKALQAVRHVMVPAVSMNWRPDFSEDRFGYYDSLVKPSTLDPAKDTTYIKYTRFYNGNMGVPLAGKSSVIGFSLTNNLEMKVGSKKDTITGNKKIKIFETLSFASDYNLLADSMKLSPISIVGRTNLFQAINLTFNGVLNPYKINLMNRLSNGQYSPGRVDSLVWFSYDWWGRGRPLGNITDASISLSLNLKGGKKTGDPKTSKAGTDAELAEINSCPECYVDFSVPWTFNVNYNLIYQKPLLVHTLTNTFTFSGDIRLTENWKIGFNSGYDFRRKEFTYTSMDVYRDLHCWEMRLNLVPFGSRQSYVFNINVKSAVLQDLKLSRRKQWYD